MCLFCWTQRKIFWRVWETEQFWAPLTSIVFICSFYRSQWCPKTAWLQTFFRISSAEQSHSYRFGTTWGRVNYITFTFSHLADAFIQSDLQLGSTWSDSSWRGKQTEEVPLTPSLRHCSNKYKLAREGEKEKEKDEDIEKGKDFLFYDEVK